MFWKISQIWQETPVLESVFNKVAGLQTYNFVKKRLQHRCYLLKFAKFLRTLFFTEHLFTVTASVCFENLGKILVRNKKIPCWQATTLLRTLLQTFPWEFFKTYKTISTAVSVAFMGSLKFWTILYLCSIVNNS